MKASLGRWVEASILDAVVQNAALRRAAGISDEARARMRPWVVAAARHYQSARELRRDDRVAIALGLLREAARLALAALLAAQAEERVDSPDAERMRWTILDHIEQASVPSALARTREGFERADALGFAALPLAEAKRLRADAELAVAYLLTLAEAREPRQIRRARALRGVLALLVAGLTLAALLAYAQALRAIAHA